MSLFSLDKALCKRDGHCIQACPAGLLAADADHYPTPTPEAEARCFDCGHCVAACPTGALCHQRLPQQDFLPAQAPMAGPDEVDALIRNRRSIRHYKPKALADDVLHGLLDTVRYAPTAINTRHVRWTVVKNPETTRALAGLVAEWTTASGYFPQALQI